MAGRFFPPKKPIRIGDRVDHSLRVSKLAGIIAPKRRIRIRDRVRRTSRVPLISGLSPGVGCFGPQLAYFTACVYYSWQVYRPEEAVWDHSPRRS